MQTRLLTKGDYLATMSVGVTDIAGTEDSASPEGVLNIWPYVAAIPPLELAGHVPSDEVVEYAYRSKGNRYDHVLIPTETKNVYLVIVVDLEADRIYGHYLLDLNAEYGLTGPGSGNPKSMPGLGEQARGRG